VLYALFVLLPVIAPFIVGYAVFVVVTSSIDPLVKAVVFAAYSVGLFLYGSYLEGYGWKVKVKEARSLLNKCESDVLSVIDEVRRCTSNRRFSKRCASSINSKVYSAVMCIEAAKEKL